jgi:uncharacterized protein YjdB
LAFLAATSCDTPTARDTERVGRIVLTPTTATLQAGATLPLSATVLDAAGNVLRDRRVVWASQNETIAIVSQAGVVVAVGPGTVAIAASSGGKSASATITVTRRPVTLVRVLPGSATISVTGSLALSAEALDATGAPIPGLTVAWTSSDETIAIVSANGVVAGIAAGSVTITATIEGRSGTAAITVALQPVASVVVTPSADTLTLGERVTFRASALDAQGLPLANRIVLWASNNPTVATVSSDGEVIGLGVGSARIRATVEGKFSDATVVVQPVPVARVAVTPTTVTLTPGQTAQLTVTLSDSAGNVLGGRTITYATSEAQIASVSASGLVTAIAQGSAQIQVSSEGKSASVAVTVNPIPIASIRITPTVVSLRVAQATRLVAEALDAQGATLANRTFTWSSSAPSVASVNQLGDVTGISAGVATITASSEGKSATATVNVAVTAVAALVISPKPVSIIPTQLQQLSVQLFDSAGGVLSQAGRPVSWLSRDPAIATVSSSGQVAGVASGSTRVVASTAGAVGTVFDSVDVTVSSPPVSSIAVQPKPVAMFVGGSAALRALVTNAGSIVRSSTVSWQSRAASIVSVSPVAGWPDSATVVGVTLGSAYVVATDAGGLSDSALVTVNTVPVASVVVTPSTASLLVGATTQLTAVAKDSVGGTLARTITWVSFAPNIASVSGSGLVTAVGVGVVTIEARAVGAGANGVDVVGSATVTVTQPAPAAVASVTVTSPRDVIVPSDTMHLTVVLRDAQNNVLTGRAITFASSATTRMTVDAAGIVTGIGTSGSSDITATSGGVSGKVHLDAVDGVTNMTVTGPAKSALDLILPVGTKKRYDVQVLDASGNGVGNLTVTISTSNASVLLLQKTVMTTGGKGDAHLDITGLAQGLASVTFSVVRAGAIPPAQAGANTLTITLPIVVP